MDQSKEVTEQEKEVTAYNLFNDGPSKTEIEELPKIEIVHQAALFELPDGNTTKELKGILLRHHKRNAWWEKKLVDGEDSQNVVPDCFAIEIIKGEPMTPAPGCNLPRAQNCNNCELNKFGSDGDGKACKNKIELFLLVPGFYVPVRLLVSPMSLKNTTKYMDSFTIKHIPFQQVTTTFTLEKVEKGQQKYSVINYVASHPEEDYEKLKKIKVVIDNYYDLMVKLPEIRDELAE